MRITGNKGEWSELYTLIKLLELRKLYAADENVNRDENVFFPIIKIIRTEKPDKTIEYVLSSDSEETTILINNMPAKTLSKQFIAESAYNLYRGIVEGNGGKTKGAFSLDCMPDIMTELQTNRLSAPSSDKTDISLQIHDIHTGYDPIVGFSIKSELGSPPTLLNASGSTNFIYEIPNISAEDAARINGIDSKSKVQDRVKAIQALSPLNYIGVSNPVFASNMMYIDSYMDDIISHLLLSFYSSTRKTCQELVDDLEHKNPLGYSANGLYCFKIKKFLSAIALGMMPAKLWNGQDEANGGYVIVKKDGDIVAYHLYNRDSFETYLLSHTKLETPSTSRHGFASIYEDNGKFYINLNLQIRFI